MFEQILINNPPNFFAGLTRCPSGLLEVKGLYLNINIGLKKSKGFIQLTTSAIWPFRKFIESTFGFFPDIQYQISKPKT